MEDIEGPSPWASSPKANRNSLEGRSSLESSQTTTANSSELPPAAISDEGPDGTSIPRSSAASGPSHSSPPNPDRSHPGSNADSTQAPPQRYNRPPSGPAANPTTSQTPRQFQYKLQPKVTGLERPSRKDLIVRFDIYVRILPFSLKSSLSTIANPNNPQNTPATSFDEMLSPSPAELAALTAPQTNLPGFRTTQFRDIRRTHAEFQKLADHLISANPEVLVPSIPPPSTPAGIGTDEDEARVKTSMQRWLTIVCSNDIVMRDEELVRFVEGDPGYSPVYKRTQPATGVRRKYIKQFNPPPDNTPELSDARPTVKKFYLATMDASQKLDRTVKARRSLGTSLATFGQTLQAMADLEPHVALKNGERKLGRTVQTTGDLHAAQATMESTVLSSALSYASTDAFIVKETLTNRQILMRDLQAAAATTRAKASATDRLRSSTSVRRDKVDEAISALDEAKEHEQYLTQKTARVTACLVHETRGWRYRTSADVRGAIKEFTIRQIEAERRQLATLETVRPDVRAIDPAGGLSRLGRDGTRVSRIVPSSQGPKGDSWSGVTRRPEGGVRGLGVAVGPYLPGKDEESAEDTEQASESSKVSLGLSKVTDDEDDDRVDAKNAASRLATSTF